MYLMNTMNKKKSLSTFFIILLICTFLAMHWVQPVRAQDEDEPIPTVTGTPGGPRIRVTAFEHDQINVRSGPGVTYPIVGVLIFAQEMPAKGRSAGGDWILIEYPGVQGGQGWVYSVLVSIIGGELPIVEPPPTPTPQFTPTVDPTLAAQFSYEIEPTKLPTFTPAPPVAVPEFQHNEPSAMLDVGIPSGLIIFILGFLGIIIALVSITQRR
jgi:hypothetical protein